MAQLQKDTRKDSGAAGGERDSKVKEFLTKFARSLTAGDGQAIARMWEVPAFAICDGWAKSLAEVEDVEKLFSGAKAEYNKRGIVDTRPEIKSLRWLSPKMALVEARWPYLDAAGAERGAETSTYTLMLDEKDQLRFRAVVMHGEEKPAPKS